MQLSFKKGVLTAGLTGMMFLTACSGDDATEEKNNDENNGQNNEATEDYSEAVDYSITGIEPGAGIMLAAEDALEDYDNLDGWELSSSSSGAMATELETAINNEEPIVVTGWSPHWKFAKFDLHYLDDPENSFGDPQTIHTIVRKGLEDDMPEAHQVLDAFEWESEDLNDVMLEIADDKDPEEVAEEWVDDNQEMVDEWTDGVDEVDGDDIELSYVEWDTEIGSTNVMKVVLENLGYDVTITPLDMAVMWESVAKGETDGMIAAWLPTSQGELYDEHEDDIEDLGMNLEGVSIGLVVPDYMDIDSIEDLEANN